MRQTQKSPVRAGLIRIAKNYLHIVAHYPEYLLSVPPQTSLEFAPLQVPDEHSL
jgi:hypothetical protein